MMRLADCRPFLPARGLKEKHLRVGKCFSCNGFGLTDWEYREPANISPLQEEFGDRRSRLPNEQS